MVTESIVKDVSASREQPVFLATGLNPKISTCDYPLVDHHQYDCRNKALYDDSVSLYVRRTKRMTGTEPITLLLRQWRSGDTAALDKLSPLVYQELHRIADHYMRGERKSHTLQPTALVNEAFMKLLGSDTGYSDRKHFYAIAARQMRHILVDYARTRERKKRGAEYSKSTFD